MGTVGPGSITAERALRRECTCSTACTTPRSRTRRCWRSAGRCRWPRWAPTSSRRSTTTCCSATSPLFTRTITSPEQAATLLEQALQAALNAPGVAVLTLPGDVGGLDLPKDRRAARGRWRTRRPCPTRPPSSRPPQLLNGADTVTMLVGIGAREARERGAGRWPRRCRRRWCSRLKAKEGLEQRQPLPGRAERPDRQPRRDQGLRRRRRAAHGRHRLPVPRLATRPGKTVIQLDARPEHIGRRTHVDLGLVGHAAPTLAALLPLLDAQAGPRAPAPTAASAYDGWRERQPHLTDPDYDKSLVGRIRERFDNTERAHPPEALAQVARPLRRRTTPCSPPTPACRRCGCRGSSRCADAGSCSARSTSARWPTRCRRPSARRRSTARGRSSRSAATAGCRCCSAT